MDSLLLATSIIGFVLALVILIIEVAFIRHQDKMRRDYFIFKKRMRALRGFKEIYYSYCVYRSHITEEISYLLTLEKLNELSRNDFFGRTEELFNNLSLNQRYQEFLEKFSRLDVLSDDFNILFTGKEAYPIQSFIFWYRSLIFEIATYKKNKGSKNCPTNTLSIESKIKKLESAYKEINETFVLSKLEAQVKIKG